jgi:Ca2+-binding RTX toxin-like protein
MIAWTHANGHEGDGSLNLDIYLQRFDADGNEIGSTVHIDKPGDQGLMDMNITTLSDGRVVLAYESETGDSTNVHTLNYQILDPRDKNILGTFHDDNILSRTDGANIQGLDGQDKLTGLGAADQLFGNDGNDILKGGGGADKLTGGNGADILTGGSGADIFVFNVFAASTVAVSGRDTITDFSHADGDLIDLHAIDANQHTTGNQDLDFIGSHDFHHVAGELRSVIHNGDTFVSGDVDGDGVADFSIKLDGSKTLSASDFHL